MVFIPTDIFYELTQPFMVNFIFPFLLIFAIVFGVLSTTNMLGKNKGVHTIIALVIGILALRSGFVQAFFANIFPDLGVGLAIIVCLVVLAGFFIDDNSKKGWTIAFYSIGALIALVIVFNSFYAMNLLNFYWWYNWGSEIIGAVIVIAVIVAVILSGGEKSNKPKKSSSGPVMFTPWRGD